jgi:ATP-dependent Clp protease adapter protein ClpS
MPHDLINEVPVKKTTEEKKPEMPPQYVIVLHANTQCRNLLTTMKLAHILMAHLSFLASEAKPIVLKALQDGHAVVKPCTKDVGETLMSLIHECDSSRCDDYEFKLELL